MRALYTSLCRFCTGGAWIAALMLAALFILGLTDMLAELLFDTAIDVTAEYSGYLVASCFFMGSGYALIHHSHIRVTLLSERLSAPAQRWLDNGAILLALLTLGVLEYGLIQWTIGTAQGGQVSYFTSQTPLWIPQAMLSLAPLFLIAAMIAHCIQINFLPDLAPLEEEIL